MDHLGRVVELKAFARALMESVRDKAIQASDANLKRGSRDPVAKRWRAANVRHAEVVIPDVVDETIFALLKAIDDGTLRLSFVPDQGETLDLTRDGNGELGGWHMGTEGWRTEFSTERFVDDFTDLAVWDDDGEPLNPKD